MNKYAFLTIALVLIFGTLGVLWFIDPDEPADPAGQEMGQLLELIERACLSQVSESKKVKIMADLGLVTGGAKAEGNIGTEDEAVRGANQDLQDELQLQENSEIRECIEQYFPQLFERALGLVPNPLEFRFDFAALQTGDPSFRDDMITLRLRSDRAVIPEEYLARQPTGYFVTRLAYPAGDERYLGMVTRTVQEEVHNLEVGKSPICFQRPSPLPRQTEHYAHLSCREGAPCMLKEFTPEWVRLCSDDIAELSLPRFTLLRPAIAQDAPDYWAIPSIETWAQRQDTLTGIGFTRFEVTTDAFRDSGAFGVETSLWVNGTPVFVDGLKPAERPVSYDGQGPFAWRFGLRSVDFQGLHAGCDELRVQLTPLLPGGDRGTPVEARRMYVSLRDAQPDELLSGSGALGWSGEYQAPQDAYENEVFMMSIVYQGGDDWRTFAANARSLQEARTVIGREKRRFDALGLEFQGQRLVAVIRPPLTKPSFGLAAGIERDTGQVHFTFTRTEANALLRFLRESRDSSAEVARVVRPDIFIYSVASNTERREHPTPPGVCEGLT